MCTYICIYIHIEEYLYEDPMYVHMGCLVRLMISKKTEMLSTNTYIYMQYVYNIYYIYSFCISVLPFQKEAYIHKLINTQSTCVYLCIKSHLLHICTSQNHKTNSRHQH